MSKLNFITPFFIVSDLQESTSFYKDELGFQVLYTGPVENPYWAMVGRDEVSIMLKAIADDIKPIPNSTRHSWARWDAFITTEDPDSLFQEFSSRGVVFGQSIGDDSDGLRGFMVTDADGYVLFFGRPKAE